MLHHRQILTSPRRTKLLHVPAAPLIFDILPPSRFLPLEFTFSPMTASTRMEDDDERGGGEGDGGTFVLVPTSSGLVWDGGAVLCGYLIIRLLGRSTVCDFKTPSFRRCVYRQSLGINHSQLPAAQVGTARSIVAKEAFDCRPHAFTSLSSLPEDVSDALPFR